MAVKLISVGTNTVSLNWLWQNQATQANYNDSTAFTHSDAQQLTGTGANQCDTKYSAQITVAASGNTVLNLSSIADPVFGGTLVFARLKMIYFELPPAPSVTQASSMALGNAAATQFLGYVSVTTATWTINKGEVLYQGMDPGSGGHVVSTGVSWKILNNDGTNTLTLNLALAGCSV